MRPLFFAAVFALTLPATSAAAWRSALYPEGWTRDATFDGGRFLHDFSWAGYHAGEKSIPEDPPGVTVDATAAPYHADPTGTVDATAALQLALDDVGAAGGGIVALPAGTYLVAPPPGKAFALHVGHSGVVLRGAGASSTFLVNTATDMRLKAIVHVRPQAEAGFDWHWGGTDETHLLDDADARATSVRVQSVADYAAGDWIVLRSDPTEAFIAEYGMTGTWTQDVGGPAYYRRITGIDTADSRIHLDTPLRGRLLTRDAARVHHVTPHLEEVAIEGLAIGNRRNTTPGTESSDYEVSGTGAYEMHASMAIQFTHVVNGWVRDVKSFAPAGNPWNVHLLSNGIRLACSRFVTVKDTDLRYPQYRGAGGNGYLFIHSGSENLVTGSLAVGGRHNYSFSLMQTTGNVVHRSESRDGKLPADFHMWLSAANLLDNLTVKNDHVEARRRTCCGHGHSTTDSVFWNVNGVSYPVDQFFEKFIVDTAQYGHGYVIGTRGAAPAVRTPADSASAPADFVEGVGLGATLEPSSLYEDQFARRMGWEPPPPPVNLAPVVDAGESLTLAGSDLPAEASVHGDVSDDGLPGAPLAFEWTAVSGPGAVGFADPFSAATQAAFSKPGDYVLRLTVSDGELAGSDDLAVQIAGKIEDGEPGARRAAWGCATAPRRGGAPAVLGILTVLVAALPALALRRFQEMRSRR